MVRGRATAKDSAMASGDRARRGLRDGLGDGLGEGVATESGLASDGVAPATFTVPTMPMKK